MDLHQPSSAPLGEPVAFLHRMDCISGEAIVTACDRKSLRSATFLDGRETFWRAERLIPLVPMGMGSNPARRFIFHIGFAGSTLLARLLDDPRDVLVLKEPQCLADIAGQRAAIEEGRAIAGLGELVDHAVGRLGDLGDEGLPVLVKPTNWANCILSELCAPNRQVVAVFITMPLRDYLVAAFRGGRDRLAFSARLGAAMALLSEKTNAAMREAVAATSDPLDQMARIVALLHWIQEQVFSKAIAANGWGREAWLTFDEILADPEMAASRARRVLDLPERSRDNSHTSRILRNHAKDPSMPFAPTWRNDENTTIEAHHGRRFDEAIVWLERQDLA